MKNQDLEELIRSLKPGPLPADLKARLAVEPMRPKSPAAWTSRFVAVAAVLMVGLVTIPLFFKKKSAPDIVSADPPAPPVSVLKKNSTLLNSRTLVIKEIEGQLWEVLEEEWRDDTLALCSLGPTKLTSTVIRREVVCNPVQFQ